MTYKKLVIKYTAAIEIEETITYYFKNNKNLAVYLEKEIRNCFLKMLKILRVFSFDTILFVLFGLKNFLTESIICLILMKCT